MFLRQAWRYRWSQALVLSGVSLLIGASAAFAPWFTRAVEQTVTTEALQRHWLAAAWQVTTYPNRDPQAPGRKSEELERLIPADVKPLFSDPLYGHFHELLWRFPTDHPRDLKSSRLLWREDYCQQVEITAGRCPGAANEVLMSVTDQEHYLAKVGSKLVGGTDGVEEVTLTVVGLYRDPNPKAEYWFGAPPTGQSQPTALPSGLNMSDALLTDRNTFAGNNLGRATLETRPLPGVARADDLDRLRQLTATVNGDAQQAGLNADTSTALLGLIDTIQDDRAQARAIVPLVMVQVALFAVVVLALALAAVADQRRPELAVARLRGASARRVGRDLFVELAIPVVAGTLAGVAVGFGLLQLIRGTWLRHGAPLEFPWTVPAAVLVAVLLGLAVVWWTVRSVVRQPISALLRRVAARYRSRTVGVIDLSIIVIAVAGLVAGLTGGNRSPLAVLTPTLLALAAGLAFAHLLLPAAGLVSRRALRQGRLGLALGALQVSRRPAVTRIVAVVAVAGALVSFAGQAASVADHNRDNRAGYETGAEAVVNVAVSDLRDFTQAIDAIDRDRRLFTPVVLVRPPSPDALKTMMIEPDSFRRVAYRGDRLTGDAGYDALRAPAQPQHLEFRSANLSVTAQPTQVEHLPADGGATELPARSLILQANVVSLRNGARYLVRFPPISLAARQPVSLQAKVDCLGGCRLLRWGIARDLNDQGAVRATVMISKVGTDDRPALPLGQPQDWRPILQIDDGRSKIQAMPGSADGLGLAVTNNGSEQFLQYATVPPVVPAFVTPEFAMVGSVTTPGFDSVPVPIEKLDGLEGPVNRFLDRTAVVDMETMRRLGGALNDGDTDFHLWLNADGVAQSGRIIDQLAKAGLPADIIDRRADRIAGYGRSASALALQLTPVVGLVGWTLAIVVLLLMVVTSWRARAQDYASLRLTGVPATTTGRAARWEQAGPVALAVLLGSVCGVIGAQVALPLIPLFASTTHGSAVPLELSVNWLMGGMLLAAGTAVLLVTTLILGAGVNRRAGFQRIREELT